MRAQRENGNGRPRREHIEERVEKIFFKELHVEIPSRETDVIDAGLLDSLTLVQLLTTLEREFELTMDLEDLDLDDFRSVTSIAGFVVHRSGREDAPAPIAGD